MRNVRSKTLMLVMILALTSRVANAQHDHAGHGDQAKSQQMEPMFKSKAMSTAYGHYIHLKNALVDSDQKAAKTASESLVMALHEVTGAEKAHTEAENITKASSLADQRKSFAALSTEMAELVKSTELSMGQVFLEFCPMANNNAGAFWLSNESEIRNPYFGNMMLKCGSVKETIQ